MTRTKGPSLICKTPNFAETKLEKVIKFEGNGFFVLSSEPFTWLEVENTPLVLIGINSFIQPAENFFVSELYMRLKFCKRVGCLKIYQRMIISQIYQRMIMSHIGSLMISQ